LAENQLGDAGFDSSRIMAARMNQRRDDPSILLSSKFMSGGCKNSSLMDGDDFSKLASNIMDFGKQIPIRCPIVIDNSHLKDAQRIAVFHCLNEGWIDLSSRTAPKRHNEDDATTHASN
jgi:hypothetical protein